MNSISLDSLSIADLDKLKNTIDATIVNKKQSELVELRQEVDRLIDSSPFTLQEVLQAKPARKPVKPKYRNPNDASQVWTGRGRKPRWIEDCLNNGMDLADLLI